MSKKIVVSNKPVAETYVHTFVGKAQTVGVHMHINYSQGTISLVEGNDSNPMQLQGKKWLFAKREIEYMQGWHDILDAMQSAVTDATKRLRDYQSLNSQE